MIHTFSKGWNKLLYFSYVSQVTAGGGGYYWRTYNFQFAFMAAGATIQVQVFDSYNGWENTFYNTSTATWDSSTQTPADAQAGNTLYGSCSTYRYYTTSPPLVATQARCLLSVGGVVVDQIYMTL